MYIDLEVQSAMRTFLREICHRIGGVTGNRSKGYQAAVAMGIQEEDPVTQDRELEVT